MRNRRHEGSIHTFHINTAVIKEVGIPGVTVTVVVGCRPSFAALLEVNGVGQCGCFFSSAAKRGCERQQTPLRALMIR